MELALPQGVDLVAREEGGLLVGQATGDEGDLHKTTWNHKISLTPSPHPSSHHLEDEAMEEGHVAVPMVTKVAY